MRVLLFLAAILFSAAAPLAAQGHAPGNVNDMILEVMRTDLGKGKEAMAMWLPQEFFVAAGLSQSPGLDPKDLEKELDFLRDYVVFMVQAKTQGEDGPVSLSSSQLRTAASLVDEAGRSVKPLTDLPPKVEATLNAVRQGFSAKGRDEFRLLVFPGRSADGKQTIASPTRRGAISLKLAKVDEFPGMALTWKTPLASFVKPATCTKCGESLQPAWAYCPWCAQPMATK